MNVVAIIQARLTSTRFPGKVLADLGGTPVAERVLQAAKRIEGVSEAVLAWPVAGIDENDVLARYMHYARLHEADVIVRLTGDCPLLDPNVSALVLKRFMQGGVAYATNVYPKRTWPDGLDTEVFHVRALSSADECAKNPYDREHVTPWIYRHRLGANVELPVDWSWVRLTVDTPQDLDWLRVAINAPRSGPTDPAPERGMGREAAE